MLSIKRILVAENDVASGHQWSNLVTSLGFQARIAEDGKRALELVKAWDPHILLLEWGLPKLSGLAVLSTLHEHESQIPTIVIMGEDETSDAVQAVGLGAGDYLRKPVDLLLLRLRLNNLADQLELAEENQRLLRLLEAREQGAPVGGAESPAQAKPGVDSDGTFEIKLGTSLDEVERELIIRTIGFSGGNKSRAAEILGVSLKTLYNRLDRYQTRSTQHSA
ncbi:MAG TPA: response regulator [Candidatus Binataceae bacterium]|jgi:DNA-binding NtrC family response regulator